MSEKKLTSKQSKFIDEYMIDLNATQAAIRAGYSKDTAKDIGCQNLAKVYIAEEIENRQKILQEKTGITTERVLAEYAKIAFSNLTDIIDYKTGTITMHDFENLKPEQKHCIKKFKFVTVLEMQGENSVPVTKVELELFDKQKALDSLARHLGMFDGKSGADDEGTTSYTFIIKGKPDAKK